MNQYYEYKDLEQYYLKESHITKKGRTETYLIPDSGEFYENAINDTLKKYDIEFLNAEKTDYKMLHIQLKVLSHGEEDKKEYDIKTFKYPYSDAVLECCFKDFLDFEPGATINQRKSKYCMTGYDTSKIAEMLEDYAKRVGLLYMKDYEQPPADLWLICYEYVKNHVKTIVTICVDCTSREKYIYDIYITNTFQEMVDKLQKRFYSGRTPFLRKICLDDIDELQESVKKAFPFANRIYDVLLIPLRLDMIISKLHNFNLCRTKLEYFRNQFVDLFKICCKKESDVNERLEALRKFVKTYDELKKIDFSHMKRGDYVTEQLQRLWDVTGKWYGTHKYDVFELMKPYNHNYHSLETYRVQYLLTIFLNRIKNISPERLRLKLLSSYDTPNGQKIEIPDAEGRFFVKEIRIGSRTLNSKDEYKPMMACAFMFKTPLTDFEFLKLISKSQIRYVSNCHDIRIRHVVRAKKIQPVVIDSEMTISNCLRRKKYRLALKPVLGPRLKEGFVTLSDVIKRLEKLVYDM